MDLLLIITIFTPLVGALTIAGLADVGRQAVRGVAFVTALVTLALAVVLVSQYEPPPATSAASPASGPAAPYAYRADGTRPDEFAVSEMSWLHAPQSGLDLKFSLGLDGLSVWLFGLSALLVITSVLVSWESVRDRPGGFYASLLVLEMGLLGVFAARDIILFYVFFEFTLVPLFFLIGIWGSEERRYAAMKFFLFTFAGSALTFLGLLAIVLWNAGYVGAGSPWRSPAQTVTFNISELTRGLAEREAAFFEGLDSDKDGVLTRLEAGVTDQPPQRAKKVGFERLDTDGDGRLTPAEFRAGDARLELWIFLALFIGFAVKVPLFPLHTWLPLAHVQAPAAGSVLLAGVLLKIGSYGFVRFCLPMLPEAAAQCMPWVLWLSVIGIIYGALVALVQNDMKKLVAYSSVSHLGFCMLGVFALNKLGISGGVLQMLNHGLSTGALFAIVGMIYERYHTRKIAALGGLATRTPLLAFFLVFFTFSSVGLPGLNGFAGEFLLLTGMFQRGWTSVTHHREFLWIAALAVSGVVLGAWYMLLLVQRTFFGPLREPQEPGHPPVSDMRWTEIGALAPLAVFVVWIGVHPGFFLDRMNGTLDPLAQRMEQAVAARSPAAATEEAAAGAERPTSNIQRPTLKSDSPQSAAFDVGRSVLDVRCSAEQTRPRSVSSAQGRFHGTPLTPALSPEGRGGYETASMQNQP